MSLVNTNVFPNTNIAKNNTFKIKINNIDIESIRQEKVLALTLNDQVNFKSHLSNLFKMVSQKLNALVHVICFMDLPKRRVIRKA